MPFSYKHYRQWKKGVTKTELHKYSWEDNYRENLCIQVHYAVQMSDQFRWYVMAIYASYSTPTPHPPGANYGNKVNLELFFHNKKVHAI